MAMLGPGDLANLELGAEAGTRLSYGVPIKMQAEYVSGYLFPHLCWKIKGFDPSSHVWFFLRLDNMTYFDEGNLHALVGFIPTQ